MLYKKIEDQTTTVQTLFAGLAGAGNQVEVKPLSPDDQPVQIVRPEFMRRMMEMQAMQGMTMQGMPEMYNVVINTNHPLIASKLMKMRSEEKKEHLVSYLYDLARLNHNMLKGADLTAFVGRSLDFLK